MKPTHAKFLFIGKFLKRARVKAGLSQGDVRDLLGYKTPQIISDWERGICGPPLSSMRKLKRAYGLSEIAIVRVWMRAEREELEKWF